MRSTAAAFALNIDALTIEAHHCQEFKGAEGAHEEKNPWWKDAYRQLKFRYGYKDCWKSALNIRKMRVEEFVMVLGEEAKNGMWRDLTHPEWSDLSGITWMRLGSARTCWRKDESRSWGRIQQKSIMRMICRRGSRLARSLTKEKDTLFLS